MLKKDQLYEVQYAGPASSIQVCGHSFSKNRKAYLKGSALQKINLKQWNLIYKEVAKAPLVKEKTAVIWTGKHSRAVRINRKRVQFPSNKKMHVTGEQLKFISKISGFKIVD